MNPIEGSRGDMVNGDVWHEIHSRFKLKEAKRSIARALGLSVQTVRKVLRQEEPKGYKRRPAEGSILKTFEVYIRQRVAAVEASLRGAKRRGNLMPQPKHHEITTALRAS